MNATATASRRADRVPIAGPLAVVGLAIVLTGIAVHPVLGWAGLMLGGLFGASLALGAAALIAINGVSGARWWLPVRDTVVDVASAVKVPAIPIAATLALGTSVLYPWAAPEAVHDHLIHGKAAWLNVPFFVARGLIVLAVWIVGIAALRRRALSGDRGALARSSAPFIVVFALSVSVAFWDWTMSLEPHWFSTMWGVYGFSGLFVGGIAAVTVVALLRARRANEEVPENVRHDLGKLLFAFSFFWAYIWFCQFMLIWYANLPEETGHFATRLSGEWAALFWLNPIVNFVVPFLVLLPARTKIHEPTLLQMALLLLVGRFLDLFLMVGPPLQSMQIALYGLAASVAVVAAMVHLGRRREALSGSSTEA